MECQSHRLTYEDEPSVEYVSRFIGSKQQRYTQRGGTRPFGLAVLIAGVDATGGPQLWSSDPSGVYYAWKVRACGKCWGALLPLTFSHLIGQRRRALLKDAPRDAREELRRGLQLRGGGDPGGPRSARHR